MPAADVIAIALPPASAFDLGVLTIDRNSRQGAFAVTALNVGASDSIIVTADTGSATLPLAITLCQTSTTGACMTPATPSITTLMSTGTGAGLAVFVTASGQVPFNAAANRIFVRFRDAAGILRGATSIAVQADVPPTAVLGAALNGAQEVPPTSTVASGTGSFTYDDVTRQLTFDIFVSHLQGAETAAQIRGPALPGTNGPIVSSLPLGNLKSGTLTLRASQGVDLLAGNLYVNVQTTAFPDGEIRGQIAQALLNAPLLPSSRALPVSAPATAFATILNGGPSTATGCGIALARAIPATFSYQTTNPATNTVTGSPKTPFEIAAGASQTFVLALTPTAPIPPTDVQLRLDCANSPPAPVITGVNTLLLSVSPTPVPDVIAIAVAPVTPFPGPGTLVLDPTTHQGAFTVSAANVGASASLTATADTGSASLPVAITLCQASATGACVNPPAPTVSLAMNSGAGAGLAVFVTATGTVRFDAAVNRIFVRFKDGSRVTRGSTSVALQAQ